MKSKIQNVLAQLNDGLVEREEALKVTLLAVLAGENVVLLGPPGTGKSLMARRISEVIEPVNGGDGYFEYLLTKFSTPDEIFGPLSISALKADRFRRNTERYLPTAKIAFLDEIFKANSSILNALLTILNERIYHNGAEPQKTPLRTLISASNEVPSEQENLAALYDRFLLRGFVDYVSFGGFSSLFKEQEPVQNRYFLTEKELTEITQRADKVHMPAEIVTVITRIWRAHKEAFKEDRNEQLSDRRLKKVIKLLKVSAVTNGRNNIDLSDVLLLKNCLWNHPDNAEKVVELVLNELRQLSKSVLNENNQITLDVQGNPTETTRAHGEKAQHTLIGEFKGNGSEQSPFLIESIKHLRVLNEPSVAKHGYHFRLTTHIDISEDCSWKSPVFHGHLDGAGHLIIGKYGEPLFMEIHNSVIVRLFLDAASLANRICKSKVEFCELRSNVIDESAELTSFASIKTLRQLIGGHAMRCTVSQCQVGGAIVAGDASDTNISDCISIHGQTSAAGIARALVDSSVHRCFVGDITFLPRSFNGKPRTTSGIANQVSGGKIVRCAIGRTRKHPASRISWSFSKGALSENYSIDTNPGSSDAGGEDGETINASAFDASFFKNILQWDFENVWEWNDTEDRPDLRSVGCVIHGIIESWPATTDFLTNKIRTNIWL